jgi:zinc transport system ATP-binding protein
MSELIEISELSVHYGGNCALSDISLKINTADFLGIIGPNGGGKTTLLRAILGLVKPSGGSISLAGRGAPAVLPKIGYVAQYTNFDRTFPITVFDVVLMGTMDKSRLFLHRYSAEDKETTLRIMERLDIAGLKDRQIGQLSGGQMQKTLLARTLMQKPDVLLLDEPTANMDALSRTKIYEILKELNKEMAIVVVTHDMSFVSSHVKSIACLNKRLYYHGEPAMDEALVREAYGCPIDLLAHGVPHRVLGEHGGNGNV